MSNKPFVKRILAQSMTRLAQRLQAQAEAEGLVLAVDAEIVGDRAHLILTGPDLLAQQYGERTLAATAPITHLVQSLGSQRRCRP